MLEQLLLKVAYYSIFMINKLLLHSVPSFIALGIYFLSVTKFSWNKENDACFNVICVLLGNNLCFLGGYCKNSLTLIIDHVLYNHFQ